MTKSTNAPPPRNTHAACRQGRLQTRMDSASQGMPLLRNCMMMVKRSPLNYQTASKMPISVCTLRSFSNIGNTG